MHLRLDDGDLVIDFVEPEKIVEIVQLLVDRGYCSNVYIQTYPREANSPQRCRITVGVEEADQDAEQAVVELLDLVAALRGAEPMEVYHRHQG